MLYRWFMLHHVVVTGCAVMEVHGVDIKYSSLTRYPPLYNTSAFTNSWNNHRTNMLPWNALQLTVGKPTTNVKFKHFNSNFPVKTQKAETLIRWHTVDWCLVYNGLMKNGIRQISPKFANWATAFWLCWPLYMRIACIYKDGTRGSSKLLRNCLLLAIHLCIEARC